LEEYTSTPSICTYKRIYSRVRAELELLFCLFESSPPSPLGLVAFPRSLLSFCKAVFTGAFALPRPTVSDFEVARVLCCGETPLCGILPFQAHFITVGRTHRAQRRCLFFWRVERVLFHIVPLPLRLSNPHRKTITRWAKAGSTLNSLLSFLFFGLRESERERVLGENSCSSGSVPFHHGSCSLAVTEEIAFAVSSSAGVRCFSSAGCSIPR
jgi:hypothetical protein